MVKGVWSLLTDLVLKKRSLFLAKYVDSLHSQCMFFSTADFTGQSSWLFYSSMLNKYTGSYCAALALPRDNYIISLSLSAELWGLSPMLINTDNSSHSKPSSHKYFLSSSACSLHVMIWLASFSHKILSLSLPEGHSKLIPAR